ncbi:MAG: hypothetical protein HYV15_01360 [Elusimicrobia bacterium]|nr:hypothetical protein [Elusimicrobiota bacterium]
MPLLEVVTVGLPFCVFKLLTGLWLLDGGAGARALGWALLVLGGLDLLINTANLLSLVFLRRRALEPCLFAMAAKALGRSSGPAWTWQDLGNSLDVLLAMSIVAYMIAVQAQAGFPEARRHLWNACVILDVMGAGLTRFGGSLKRLSGAA